MTIPVALTIAGSDSGGGAGIQADLKTFHAFGVFGTSAVTAITAQNTQGVKAVHAVPADVVAEQIHAVVTDFTVGAIKTGMLATRQLVGIVATVLRDRELRQLVVDPVMVASSGDRLLDEDAEAAIVTELLPLCMVVTPNLDEAAVLTGIEVRDEESMRAAARMLVEKGAGAALIKGGHLPGQQVLDVFYEGSIYETYERPRIESHNTHGTGCTLSAAITAGSAHGRSLKRSIEDALDYVNRAIESAPGLGQGHGPLNHFVTAPTN